MDKKRLVDREFYVPMEQVIEEVKEIISWICGETYTDEEIRYFKNEIRDEIRYM